MFKVLFVELNITSNDITDFKKNRLCANSKGQFEITIFWLFFSEVIVIGFINLIPEPQNICLVIG